MIRTLATLDLWRLQFGDVEMAPVSPEAAAAARERFERLSYCFAVPTFTYDLPRIARRYGLELMRFHGSEWGFDVVGTRGRERFDRYRIGGVQFRYFDSHADRLADFQMRLDAAKLRARR